MIWMWWVWMAFAEPPVLDLPAADTGGRELLATMPEAGRERTRLVARALLDGQIPSSLRVLEPLRFRAPDGLGLEHEVTLWVTRDFLQLGTEADSVYAPLDLPAARRVARALYAVLPTPEMSDRIYAAADTVHSPQPIPASPRMGCTDVLLEHQELVEAEADGEGLVAGHKKDVVLDEALAERPDRVAIYGWHRRSGDPIQPVSLWHGEHYVDYSHGVRLVSREMQIDGRTVDLIDVLGSEIDAPLVCGDGALPEELLRDWR